MSDIKLSCPKCGVTLKVRAQFAGKKIKCPKCSAACPVPAAPAEAEPPSPPVQVKQVEAMPATKPDPAPRNRKIRNAPTPRPEPDEDQEQDNPKRPPRKSGAVLNWFAGLVVVGYLTAVGLVQFEVVGPKAPQITAGGGMADRLKFPDGPGDREPEEPDPQPPPEGPLPPRDRAADRQHEEQREQTRQHREQAERKLLEVLGAPDSGQTHEGDGLVLLRGHSQG